MPKQIKLREVSAEEEREIRRFANARKEAVEVVRRARLLEYLLDHPKVSASQAGMEVGFGSNASGAQWVKRFNEEGIPGLQNKPKSGRPVTHCEEVRSKVIDLALQKPQNVGYPFALWTLSRLQIALAERHQLNLARSTIWKVLEAEGLDWKRQQSWFHEPEQHDPEFVEKRGASFGRM
jgi:transposase